MQLQFWEHVIIAVVTIILATISFHKRGCKFTFETFAFLAIIIANIVMMAQTV